MERTFDPDFANRPLQMPAMGASRSEDNITLRPTSLCQCANSGACLIDEHARNPNARTRSFFSGLLQTASPA
eukprot:6920544-Alexandrium_andersonii.AAC.1